MRSNSSLYDRMCRGDMDAWADPGAILEMLACPGRDLSITAADMLRSHIRNQRELPDNAASNLMLAFQSEWGLGDCEIDIVSEISLMDMDVRRETAGILLEFVGSLCNYRASRPVYIRYPEYIRREGEVELAGKISEFSQGGDILLLSNWKKLVNYEEPLASIAKWCIDPREKVESSIAKIAKVGGFLIGKNKWSTNYPEMARYVAKRLGDPVPIVGRHLRVEHPMVKNRRRRR